MTPDPASFTSYLTELTPFLTVGLVLGLFALFVVTR